MAHTKFLNIYGNIRHPQTSLSDTPTVSTCSNRENKPNLHTLLQLQLDNRNQSIVTTIAGSVVRQEYSPSTSAEEENGEDLDLIASTLSQRSRLFEIFDSETMSSTNQVSNIDFILNRQHRRSLIRILPGHTNRSIFYYCNRPYSRSGSSTRNHTSSSSSNSSSNSLGQSNTLDSSSQTSSASSSFVLSSYQHSPISSYSTDSNDSIFFASSSSNSLTSSPVSSIRSNASSPTSRYSSQSPYSSRRSFVSRSTLANWAQGLAPLRSSSRNWDLEEFLHSDESACSMLNSFPSSEYKRTSRNINHFLNARLYGNHIVQQAKISDEFALGHLLRNNVLKERPFDLDQMNKVFCSQWLNDRHVILGTKCNNLIVLDVINGKKFPIETLQSRKEKINANGMHFIEINPSKTLLATGATHGSDIAIYRLPSLEPYCILEGPNEDLIFDVCWLDDEYLASGSRDSTLALWHLQDEPRLVHDATNTPLLQFIEPRFVAGDCKIEKIRSLTFNSHLRQIAALSLKAELHLFDPVALKYKQHCDLTFDSENVCLTEEPNLNLYAVGSKGHVQLIDNRNLSTEVVIASVPTDCGIRSLSFNDKLLTIGTGQGALLFYDIRNEQYLSNHRIDGPFALNTSKGWVDATDINQAQNMFWNADYKPAIYTHQWDIKTKSRVFAAGGPLPVAMKGSYVGIFE